MLLFNPYITRSSAYHKLLSLSYGYELFLSLVIRRIDSLMCVISVVLFKKIR